MSYRYPCPRCGIVKAGAKKGQKVKCPDCKTVFIPETKKTAWVLVVASQIADVYVPAGVATT